MTVLYIAADRPQAGATAVVSALAREASSGGRPVATLKPLSPTGASDADAAFFASHVTPTATVARPLAIPTQQGGTVLSRETIDYAAKVTVGARKRGGVVLVEGLPLTGAHGLSPADTRAIADAMDAKVVLVVGYRPDLRAEDVRELAQPLGGRLVGVLLNGVTRHRGHDVATRLVPALDGQGVHILGTVPEDREMVAATVSQLAQAGRAEWVLNDEFRDRLVEHVMIGGFMMDWGQIYFGRKANQAVVVRVDRPDLQMAALRVEHAPSCLVLTEGPEPFRYEYPAQYVRHEAVQREVPVLRVAAPTVETARRLEALASIGTVHHPIKVQRYQSLLRAHADVDALLALAA